MVMVDNLDRFHPVMDVIDRVPGLGQHAPVLRVNMIDERLRHRAYTRPGVAGAPPRRRWHRRRRGTIGRNEA
jgi:xylulose-5-phosphate/fructose-6-phosphate phosphoketolase